MTGPLWSDGSPALRIDGRSYAAEQVAPVETRDGPLGLAANAGSGKTAVLVERFARAVEVDAISADRILAITFTDKAAGELRQRIRDRFEAKGDRASMRALEGAWITTFHGYCMRLLRLHPLHAGIDPQFTVLDEVDAGALQSDAFDQASGAWLDAAAAVGTDALDVAASYRADRLEQAIRRVHAQQRSAGLAEPRLPDAPPPPDPVALRQKLERTCAAAAADLAGAQTGLRVDQARDALARCSELLLGLPAGAIPDAASCDELGFSAQGKALKGLAAQEYLAAVDEVADCEVAQAAAKIAPILGDLLVRFGACYAERKRKLGALDFEDLQLEAVALLRRDAQLREAQRQRFELVMADEFQDTNGVQLDLLTELDSGNLFTVGDPLQSIYGFRHADVSIMRRRQAELGGADRALTLATNYRSRRPVLDAVNAIFAPLFGEHDFTPLEAGRDDADEATDAPLVELLVTDSPAWEVDDAPDPSGGLPGSQRWRHAEARLLAQRVSELVQNGDAAPKDIVVLMRALTDIRTYDRALRDAGLATQVTAGRGYWDSAAVRDVVAYLAVLANPRDEERLFELLASPLVGVGVDALALIAHKCRGPRRGTWQTLASAFCEGGDGADGLADALAPADASRLWSFCPWFEAERRAAPRFALDVLVERAVLARGADLEILRHPEGERRLANLRKFTRLAREHEARGGRDIRSFLDRVARQEELEAREGEAPVEGEGDGAVRLMTIHAAKGLEFGVVVLADLGRTRRQDHPDLLVVGDRIGLRRIDSEGKSKPALDLEELLSEQHAAQDAEEQRVLYVAMTRAKERLILSGALDVGKWPDGSKPTAPPLAWIAQGLLPDVAAMLPETPQAEVVATFAGRDIAVAVERNAPDTLGAVLRHESLAPALTAEPATETPPLPAIEDAPAPTEPGPSPVRTVSYSGLQAYGNCGYRFYATKVLRLPATQEQGREPSEGLAAHTRGSLVHGLLEKLDFEEPGAPAAEAIELLAAAHGVELAAEDVAEISELVGGFASSELARRLASAQELRREAGFAFALGVGAGEPILINGFVDVLASEEDRSLVLDYKTNRVEEGADLAELAARDYGTQRLVYALAALRQGAHEVEVIYSYLRLVEQPLSMTFRREQMAELEKELAGLAAGVVRGEFPVAPVPHNQLCNGCPVRGTLCSHPIELTRRDYSEAFGPPSEPPPDPPEGAYEEPAYEDPQPLF